jgi:hypothetical protein
MLLHAGSPKVSQEDCFCPTSKPHYGMVHSSIVSKFEQLCEEDEANHSGYNS